MNELTDGEAFTHFDHFDRRLAQDPYPTYAALRTQCPIAPSDRYGGFHVISRYEDIRTVASHPEIFSNREITIPPAPAEVENIPGYMDPPYHARYRAVVAASFSPARVRRLEDRVLQIVNDVIDCFVTLGVVDVVPALSREVPRRVLVDLLGVADADAVLFQRWVDTLFGVVTGEVLDFDLENYLFRLVDERKGDDAGNGDAGNGDAGNGDAGAPDVVRQFLSARSRSAPLSANEIVRMLIAVIEGSLHTTQAAISGMVLLLADDPALRDRLADSVHLQSLAVEEFLRWTVPVHNLARVVKAPFRLGDTDLQPGDRVLLLWASANRDDSVFEDPDVFVPDRKPNPHLTFGYGTHRCVGMHLARLQIRLVLQQVLSRISNLERVDPELDWYGGSTRGLTAFKVAFTPGLPVTGRLDRS